MGPATAACKKLKVKSLPWNRTVFKIKPQERFGRPFAPFRRGPNGLLFDLQGTMLSVALESTKYLSLVNSSMRKIKSAFAGKCMAVAMACTGVAAELLKTWRLFSFTIRSKGPHICLPLVNCNCGTCTCHSQGCENWKIMGEERQLFEQAPQPLLLLFLPLAGVGLLLCWVMAAVTMGSCFFLATVGIPQGGVHDSNHHCCRLVVTRTYCLLHGGQLSD